MDVGSWVIGVVTGLLVGGVIYWRSHHSTQPAADQQALSADPFLPYIDGLLTTLARTPGKPFVLGTDKPLPRLTELTTDPAQLAYVSRLPVNYGPLTVDSVIGYLVGRAGHANRDDPEIETVLHAKLAGPQGEDKDTSFRLKLTKRERPWQLVITVE